MLLFWLFWVGLVLGGAAGGLSCIEALRGKWLLSARVPARVPGALRPWDSRCPVWQRLVGARETFLKGGSPWAARPGGESRAGPARPGAAR